MLAAQHPKLVPLQPLPLLEQIMTVLAVDPFLIASPRSLLSLHAIS
jgi:hypothetical protein